MPRVEIALRTPLRFHSRAPDFAPPAIELGKTETVAFEFEGRTFVWHVFDPTPASTPFGEQRWAPTVSVVHDDDVDRPEAAASVARLLSALAFHYNLIVDVDGPFYATGSGESDPFRPAIARAIDTFATGWTEPAPERIEVVDDQRLRLALAVYREGVNAQSPYLGFLAYWGVLDAVYGPHRKDVDAFVNAEASKGGGLEDYAKRVDAKWTAPEDETVAAYLRDHSRNAIAHVIRGRDDLPHIDPDDPAARVRLGAEGYWVREIARRAILTEWPNAVTVEFDS
jgi:hypothetical protein